MRRVVVSALLAGSGLALLYGVVVSSPPPPLVPLVHPLGRKGVARISSRFGPRVSPISGAPSMHSGVDLATPIGTPVYAVADGSIVRVDSDGVSWGAGNGNAVILRAAGYRWAYLHLDRVAAGVVTGAAVRQGQVLGYTGNTGRSTGPHLHFQATLDSGSVAVDPEPLFESIGGL